MKKISIHKIIAMLTILFPITTVLQGLAVFENINRVMMFFLIIILALNILLGKMDINDAFVITLTIVLYTFAFIYTKNSTSINSKFYYVVWILYFLYLKKSHEKLMFEYGKLSKAIRRALIIWNIVVMVSMFFSTSYRNGFFSPFACGEHRFGSCCLIITAFSYMLVINTRKRINFIYCIVPILGICMCGARTYLAVYVIFFLCLFYLNTKKKMHFYLLLIPMLVCIFLLIKVSPVGGKIVDTYSEGHSGFLATVTSGRSKFWVYDIQAFLNLSFMQQFVGNGFDFVYNVNLATVNKAFWAHNDFINILMNFGYIGLVLYFYVLFKYSNALIKKQKMKRIQRYSFYAIWLFNAFFNMVYTYTIATLAMPFILFALGNDYFILKKKWSEMEHENLEN